MMIQGDWKDSVERKIELVEWDEATVMRLAEWLYSGDYSLPDLEVVSYSFKPSTKPKQGVDASRSEPPSALQILRSSLPISISRVFHPLDSHAPDSRDEFSTFATTTADAAAGAAHNLTPVAEQTFRGIRQTRRPFSVLKFQSWTEDHPYMGIDVDVEPLLLAHAQVYCIAEYTLSPNLQALAFEHIRAVFGWMHPLAASTGAVGAVIQLVQYVYANTSKCRDEEEPLQKLVSTFVAHNFDNFKNGGGEKVRRLIGEGGDFVVDLFEKVGMPMRALNDRVGGTGQEAGPSPTKKRPRHW